MTVDLTAIHEASHAVTAYRLGYPPACVSIRPKDAEAGRMYHGPEAKSAAGDPQELAAFAVIALAGGVAETFAATGQSRLVDLDVFGPMDRQAAMTFCELASRERPERVLGAARLRARTVVELNWPAIQRVAAELERRTVLTAAEVADLLIDRQEEEAG